MSRRDGLALVALGLVLLLLFQVAMWALPGAAESEAERVLAITEETAEPRRAFQEFDGRPPATFDIDGDGTEEIIAQNNNQWVYVFDSETGEILFETRTRLPPGWDARTFNGPEVVQFTQGGPVHLVVANSAAIITAYRFIPGASTADHFEFKKAWEHRLDDCHDNPGMDAKPVLADLDQDGHLEVLGTTEEQGIYALDADGRLYWKNCLGGGNAAPAVADLDQDGWPDVVHVDDQGQVSALDGRSGVTLWTYAVRDDFDIGSGSMPVTPGVGQLDGKAGPDVVVGVRDSHEPSNWSKNHALLLALDSHGQLLWGRQSPEANPLTYTTPIVVDADGDGENEVYWGDWNTNGHKPPWNHDERWKNLGPAHVYRYNASGNQTWNETVPAWWSNKNLALADVDADGVQEVLVPGPWQGDGGIWLLDIRDGSKEGFINTDPWKVQRAPIVTDLYGTGQMQIVVEVQPNSDRAPGPGILVFDTAAPYDAAWPHPPTPAHGHPDGFVVSTPPDEVRGAWWRTAPGIASPSSPLVWSWVDGLLTLAPAATPFPLALLDDDAATASAVVGGR